MRLGILLTATGLLVSGLAGAAEPPDSARIRDPSRPPVAPNEFADNWFYGGRVEWDTRLEENFDLDGGQADRVLRLRPQARLTLVYAKNHVFARAAIRYSHRAFPVDEDDSRASIDDFLIDDLFVTFRSVQRGLNLTFGRFQVKDDRNWLSQLRLDGIRATYTWQTGQAYFTVNSRDVAPRNVINDPDIDRVINYILYGEQQIVGDLIMGAYLIIRDNTDEAGDLPVYTGFRARGSAWDAVDYWAEFSLLLGTTPDGLGGKEANRALSFEAGATWRPDLPLKPSLSLSFAYGSGDGDQADGKNRTFRQTGLGGAAQNRSVWNGTTFFNYYGELLQPNLSNLQVFTVGAGFRPWPKSSIDVIFHHYRQNAAAPFLGFNVDPEFPAGVDPLPIGLSRDIGREIDVIAGYKEIAGLDLELAFGVFFPGRAFATRGAAIRVSGKVKYNF